MCSVKDIKNAKPAWVLHHVYMGNVICKGHIDGNTDLIMPQYQICIENVLCIG